MQPAQPQERAWVVPIVNDWGKNTVSAPLKKIGGNSKLYSFHSCLSKSIFAI